MRLLSARLIISLIVGITLVSSAFSYYEVVGEKRALRSDLEHRADLLSDSLVGNAERAWNPGHDKARELQQLVERFGNREHLMGVAIYDRTGDLIAVTPDLRQTLRGSTWAVMQVMGSGHDQSLFLRVDDRSLHILASPIRHEDEVVGGLVVVHDASYIRSQILLHWRQSFLHILAQVVIIVLVTLLIIRWSIGGPIARAALWMRALRTGKVSARQRPPDLAMFRPLAREVGHHGGEPEPGSQRGGKRSSPARRRTIHVDRRSPVGAGAHTPGRQPFVCGLQPRALHAPAQREGC